MGKHGRILSLNSSPISVRGGWQAEISYCIFQGIVLRVRVGLLMGIWAFCLYNSAQLAHYARRSYCHVIISLVRRSCVLWLGQRRTTRVQVMLILYG